MALLLKRVKEYILLLLFFIVYAKVTFAADQNQNDGIVGFDNDAIKIEKLIDSNVSLAHTQLQKYSARINELSLKQKITYQHLLSDIYILQGQFNLTKEAATKGVLLALELSSPSLLISELLYNRGFSYENMGENSLATSDYESGLELAESLHDSVLIATGLINLGAIYYLTDRYEDSLIALNDAYNIAKQTDDEELKGSVNSESVSYTHLTLPTIYSV